MNIELNNITVRDLVEGYSNNGEEGVVAYGGKLDVRPPYQREFVYKDKQRNAVLDTVNKGFPLNIMYWVKTGEDTYEILDGQQRTLSICTYVNGDYSIDFRFFHNLTDDEKEHILNYELTVYICEGTDREKLDWFRVVNIAGEKLTEQELRNAVYTGAWLADAKRRFSRSNAPAVDVADGYMSGSPLRQDYLEKTLKWINDGEIEAYMAEHQQDRNANELWLYFMNVMEWAKTLFPNQRREMKSVDWGYLYNKYREVDYDADEIEALVYELMLDEEVKSKSGIYNYIFDRDERNLNLRSFPLRIKRAVYEEQGGKCNICRDEFAFDGTEADHITPWSEGGKTTRENCQILCKSCNRRKSAS